MMKKIVLPHGMPDGDKSYTVLHGYVAAFLIVQIGNDSSCIVHEPTAAYNWLDVHEPGNGMKSSSATWKAGKSVYTTVELVSKDF